MLKAVIFDFDGIIADTEPTHFEAFRNVLADIGIELKETDYYESYLAYDDKKLFEQIMIDKGRNPDKGLISSLIINKNKIITNLFSEHVVLFPGFLKFLESIKGKYKIAIASGALKSEIELVLDKFNIKNYFHALTAADDVVNCKPDPEVFLKSLRSLNELNGNKILAEECLVIEDSVYGIQAAKSANMYCLAITHTYQKELLDAADLVVESYMDVDMEVLNKKMA